MISKFQATFFCDDDAEREHRNARRCFSKPEDADWTGYKNHRASLFPRLPKSFSRAVLIEWQL
jgi:hypothetical protein